MNAEEALNKVCKWRSILSGRVWGTAPKSPQTKGRNDIFERLIILRVEGSAIAKLLIEKGIFTSDEFGKAVGEEALAYDEMLEEMFPGIHAEEDGMVLDLPEAIETMRGWPS